MTIFARKNGEIRMCLNIHIYILAHKKHIELIVELMNIVDLNFEWSKWKNETLHSQYNAFT